MSAPTTANALALLGGWAASSPHARAAREDVDALRRVVANLLAVTAGGAALAEQVALRAAWAPAAGPATLIGTGVRTTVETAAWLNAVAAVCTERDEGNRHSKGHPAAQTVPAVLALAESLGLAGDRVWDALLVGYEVAARVGRATDFAPEVHTHGPLGAVGAAAGCAVLLGADAAQVARAIDVGAAMAPATSWSAVLGGSAVRDQWVGQGAVAGIAAARYAMAGLPGGARGLDGRLAGTLGAVDPSVLVDGLDGPAMVRSGYLKRHAACAYTHGPADAALAVRGLLGDDAGAADIVRVEVDCVGPAVHLDAASWTSRHGAFFSVPFAVASALLHGDVSVDRSSVPADPSLTALAALVEVRDGAAALSQVSASSRPARVAVTLRDGRVVTASVAHPRGDSADTPFGDAEIRALLDEALAPTGLAGDSALAAIDILDDPRPDAVTRSLSHLTPLLEGAPA